MNPKIKIKIKPVTEESLTKKFAISYIFMSLVPIIVILFIISLLQISPILQRHFPYFNLTILLVLLLSLACFDLVRRSMSALVKFARQAKEISEGKYGGKIETKEKDEVGSLAQSFNRMATDLQVKIRELELSKVLLLDILQKIGTAVSSTKGIENLLGLIIRTLIQGTEATSGAIFLLDGTENQLEMKVSFGIRKTLGKVKPKTEQSLVARVVSSRKPESISAVSENPACAFEFSNGLAKESIMGTPLLYKDEIVGVIVISDKNNRDSFSADDIILLNNVASQTAVAVKNFQLNDDAEKTYLETITALAVAVEAKDFYSKGHLERVADYVEKLGNRLKLDNETMKVLRNGAILHDVGKIGIRDEILRKGSSFSDEEKKEMREHVIIGVNIIRPIRSMATLCDVVRHHQEFYDGSGYPDSLKGEEIPLAARILKICDAYDAMTTDRPYRKGMDKKEAKQELKRKSGSEFDPNLVEEFLKIS